MSVSRSVRGNWAFSWNFILDSTHNSIIAVDKNGHIVIFNAAARRTLKCIEDIIGRHIREIIPETRLPVVLKTGRPELGKKMVLNNTLYLTHRTPILRLGEVVGALEVFEEVSYLKNLAEDLCDMPKTNTLQPDVSLNRINNLKAKLAYYQEQLEKVSGSKYRLSNVAGKSRFVTQIKESIKKIASGDSPVLLRGEKGTGKEFLAHIMHSESKRRTGPFVRIECSLLPENALETELAEKLEIADEGTVFLDEIGHLSLHMQAKLLEVLQNKTGDRLQNGINARLIATTSRNLEEMVKQNLFREELYYRLNFLTVYIPPLRDRVEDIEPLAHYFISVSNQDSGKKVTGISSEAYSLLLGHSWPGNIKELEKVLKKAFNSTVGIIIEPQHLPQYLRKHENQKMTEKNSLRSILDDTEKTALLQALQATNGNKVKAAKLLGISRAGLYQKLEKYNLLNE